MRKQGLRPNIYGNTDCTGSEWELAVGEVYGFRSWNIDDRGRLQSPSQSYVWKPGKNIAFDREEYSGYSSAPEGFYAYYDRPSFGGDTHGVIKAYGHVSEGSRGFTAEYADVVALVDPNKGFRNPLLKPFSKFYARHTWSTLAGIGIPAGITAIVALIFGFLMMVLPPVMPVLGVILMLAGVLLALISHGSLTAESMVDNMGGKSTYLASLKRRKKYPLSELYPNAKIYRSTNALISAYGEIVEASRPGAITEEITPQDDRFWE